MKNKLKTSSVKKNLFLYQFYIVLDFFFIISPLLFWGNKL